MKTSSLALALALSSLAVGCADLSRSRDLANPQVSGTTLAQQVCSNCHGVNGDAVSPNFPKLAGQVEAYTIAQLKGFKTHSRQDPAGFEYMWGLSRSLTDDQISGLARYYAAKPPMVTAATGTAEQIAAGKLIYDQGVPGKSIPACATCHGPQAQGMATFPRLAGQHADYLVKQLGVFQRSDDRPEGAIMKTIAHELTQADIDNVAAYLESVPN